MTLAVAEALSPSKHNPCGVIRLCVGLGLWLFVIYVMCCVCCVYMWVGMGIVLHGRFWWSITIYNKSVYIQDGRQAAILNDIKNLFDVHNPQTVPVLGLKFQTSWPIHFWEIAVHGRTYGRTYGRTDGGQIISPPFWGLKMKHIDLCISNRAL